MTNKTRAAVVNSLYWKGRWAAPFAADATKSGPFTGLAGRRTETRLMHQRGEFRTAERQGVRAIELPYVGGEVSMVVLLPDAPSALPQFERQLTGGDLARWVKALEDASARDTALILPRMSLDWRKDLVPTLESLGAALPFSDDADYSGITVEPFPGEVAGAKGLTIKHVIHQTRLDVDEQGSEASAATAVLTDVVVSGLRRGPAPPPPFIFRADKPFLFLLRDRRTGLILFMGRYVAPSPP